MGALQQYRQMRFSSRRLLYPPRVDRVIPMLQNRVSQPVCRFQVYTSVRSETPNLSDDALLRGKQAPGDRAHWVGVDCLPASFSTWIVVGSYGSGLDGCEVDEMYSDSW